MCLMYLYSPSRHLPSASWATTVIIAVAFSLLLICSPGAGSSCGRNAKQPLGDITADSQVQEGTHFAIRCSLSQSAPDHLTASHIMFHFGNETVPQSRTRMVDSRSAEVVLDSAKVSDSGFYYCYVANPDPVLVCNMHLEVGSAPSPIGQENMSCISEDYENLTCTWHAPDLNTRTTYTLSESLGPGRVADCPIRLSENSCRWTSHSHPAYRMFARRLKLMLTITNRYGSISEPFYINHFEIIRPGRPADVSIVDVTSTSVSLAWKKHHGFDFGDGKPEEDRAIPRLEYEVRVFQLPTRNLTSSLRTESNELRIPSLTPYTAYEFSVRCKTTEAKGEQMWSVPAVVSIATKADGEFKTRAFFFAYLSLSLYSPESSACLRKGIRIA